MRWSEAEQKEGANRGRIPTPNIHEGSQVWLDAQHIRTTRPTRKVDWKRLGPCTVVRQISPYADALEFPTSIGIHRVQPVSLLDPIVNDALRAQRVDPPPLVEVDGKEQYQVSSVEDSRMYRNQLQYHIWWTGYDSLTWEPAKLVDGLQTVGVCHQPYSGKQGPLGVLLGGHRT